MPCPSACTVENTGSGAIGMNSQPSFLTSPLLQAHGITGIYSQRKGGVSPAPFDSLNLGLALGDKPEHIHSNLNSLCHAAHLPIPHQLRQVHGIDHYWYQGSGSHHHDEGDILLSQTPNTALAVRTADCLPILMYDPVTGIAAAIHAGWRGTAAGIARQAVKQMCLAGAEINHIIVSMGPCIADCCFQVDQQTAGQLTASHPDAGVAIHHRDGAFWPDLAHINTMQLNTIGITEQHIESIHDCTCCHAETYFSHRRDREQSGRQLAIILLPATDRG